MPIVHSGAFGDPLAGGRGLPHQPVIEVAVGRRFFGTSGSCIVSTSCLVLAGTPPKLSAGLTPPPGASQVYFDGIFSPCLNAGEVKLERRCGLRHEQSSYDECNNQRRLSMHGSPLLSFDVKTTWNRDGGRSIASNARHAAVPVGRSLECMREREHVRFTETRSADLQTDRKARTAEAARNGNGRKAVDVEGLGIAQRRRDTARWRDKRSVDGFVDRCGNIGVVGVTSTSTFANTSATTRRSRSSSRFPSMYADAETREPPSMR